MTKKELTTHGLYAHLENVVIASKNLRRLQKKFFAERKKLSPDDHRALLSECIQAEKKVDFWNDFYTTFFVHNPPPDQTEYTQLIKKIQELSDKKVSSINS